VCHHDLFSAVLRLLATRFGEADVELLLLSLTHAGFQLRADDPAALRDVLRIVHEKIAAAGPAAVAPAPSSSAAPPPTSAIAALAARFTSSARSSASASSAAAAPPSLTRVQVMSELLLDLKNNRRRAEHEQLLERGAALRKWLSRLASRTAGVEGVERRLRVGWADLMSIQESGRWWLVGASWAGRAAAGATSAAAAAAGGDAGGGGSVIPASRASASDGAGAADASAAARYSEAELGLLEAARAMRMNTSTRRAVFVALMGAEDADAALERLLRLGLTGAAEREIVRVLLDCAAQEAGYNPFYAAVGAALCSYHHRFKFTFQLAFWDAFKTIPDAAVSTPRRLFHLARLLSALIASYSLSLAVVKVLDFTTSEPPALLFIKALLTSLLLDVRTPRDAAAVFSRLGAPADRLMLRDGLQVFMHQHIRLGGLLEAAAVRAGPRGAAPPHLQRDAVKERLRAARRGLDSVAGTLEEEVLG
jgi:nucleolar MIF4G domain-containing protein 1